MLDLPTAMRVTENCIRATVNLFPPSEFPINPEDRLLKLGIDNERIDLLKTNIAGSPHFGLPSLTPKRKIDLQVLAINEGSTVSDVFIIVQGNTILA
jgi:hypothetical protein